jgi:putative membrane protein
MIKQFIKFLIRWLANCIGLLLTAHLFGLVDYNNKLSAIVIGGFILSLLNAFLKPLLVIFTLPAIALTLGIFMIVINGLIVYLATLVYQPLDVVSFWAAILVGLVIGLVNYLITALAEKFEVVRA